MACLSQKEEEISTPNSNYSKIAKNTVFLFFRMILTMGIGLYTSRVLLNVLGVEDYGINNLVGGFVAMFAIVSSALTGAISRFITFELGRGDIDTLRQTFQSSIVVMFGLSFVIIILCETFGLWFLYNKLVIPETRLSASFWVFQLSIIGFILNLLSVPYNACIVSHEKMSAFAYISIIEAVCKLLTCFAIIHSPIDRLVFFSILSCLVGIGIRIIYIRYCKKRFKECQGAITCNKKIIKRMFNYAGWDFIGSSSWILRGQGGTILLNLFGGPIVNAANAIATSLSVATSNFVNCFTIALAPQITKNYANGHYNELNKLLIYGSKISFYLLFIIALPVFLNTNFILTIWLGSVPEHTVNFVRLILLMSLIDIISVPLIKAKNATGNIKSYNMVTGSIQLMAIPLAYMLLKFGACVELLYVAYIIVSIGCLITRIYMLDGTFPNWSTSTFLVKVCLNISIVVLTALILPIIIHINTENGWKHLFATCIASIISCGLSIYFLGLTKNERKVINAKTKYYFTKHK